MYIIPITKTSDLPIIHHYQGYVGTQEAAAKKHQAAFPHYDPGRAFYFQQHPPFEGILYVPMEWNREAADAKTD